MSRRSPKASGTARNVSAGLGSVVGLMSRVSAPLVSASGPCPGRMPSAVATNHRASTQPMHVSPQRKAVPVPVSPRSGRAGSGADGSRGELIPAPRRRP